MNAHKESTNKSNCGLMIKMSRDALNQYLKTKNILNYYEAFTRIDTFLWMAEMIDGVDEYVKEMKELKDELIRNI